METADKQFEVKEIIEGQDGKIEVFFKDGTSLIVSPTEHKEEANYEGGRVRIPSINDPHLVLVQSPLSLKADGTIIELPTYWRRGNIVQGIKKNVLVTVTFRFKNELDTKCQMPFGKWVCADVQICTVTDKKRGVERVIINYLIRSDKAVPEYEIKIAGKKREKTVYFLNIPGTREEIIVNKL